MAENIRYEIEELKLNRWDLLRAIQSSLPFGNEIKTTIKVKTPGGNTHDIEVNIKSVGVADEEPGMCKLECRARPLNPGTVMPKTTLYLNIEKATGYILLPDPLP